MIKIWVWFRAYWKDLLTVIGLCVLLAFIIMIISLCALTLKQNGLKLIFEDIWYGEGNKQGEIE